MATIPGEKFDRDYKGVPPGMSAEDYYLWQQYKNRISENCEGIYFNVYLGKGTDPGENETDKWRKFWIQKTQLRADCILVYKDYVKIVEFRDRADANVIGRLLAYKILLADDNPFRRSISCEVVTNFQQDIVERLCQANGFSYTVL